MTKICSVCKQDLPESEFYFDKRRGSLYSRCKSCHKVACKKWIAENPEKRKEIELAWNDANREKRRSYSAAWKERNQELMAECAKNRYAERAESIKATLADWRKSNPELVKAQKVRYRAKNRASINQKVVARNAANPEQARARRKRWEAKNPHKLTELVARRRSIKKCATPTWANHWMIEQAYELAKVRTETFGFSWEVDHIIPLKSSLVCGLHVIENLRVIPATLNRKKSNRFVVN